LTGSLEALEDGCEVKELGEEKEGEKMDNEMDGDHSEDSII
jgi:hypothetical protein